MILKYLTLNPKAIPPAFAHDGDSGFDLHSIEDIMLYPGMCRTIPTGLSFEIEKGYELQVRPKSGLSTKSPLRVILGTIDSSYRGEVSIIVECYTIPYHIEIGDKIAQGVIVKLPEVFFQQVETLSSTTRGNNGFGSTGIRKKGRTDI